MSEKTKRPWVQCKHCLGHGMIPLPNHLNEVLVSIKKVPGIDSLSLAKVHEIEPTAMNGRLSALYEAGFVTRTKAANSRLFSWRVAPSLSRPKPQSKKSNA